MRREIVGPILAGHLVTLVTLLAWFGIWAFLSHAGLLDLPTVPGLILSGTVGYGCGRLGRFVIRTRQADTEVRALRDAIERHERDGRGR